MQWHLVRYYLFSPLLITICYSLGGMKGEKPWHLRSYIKCTAAIGTLKTYSDFLGTDLVYTFCPGVIITIFFYTIRTHPCLLINYSISL